MLALPSDLLREFYVDDNGKVFARSIRAVGRLCNKHHSFVYRLLEKIAQADLAQNELPHVLKPFAGMDFKTAQEIPDMLVAAILMYTAISEPDNEEAQCNNAVMCGVGIRSYFQKELGWTTPNPLDKMPSHAQSLRGWADALERAEKAEQQILEDAPKIEAYKAFINSHSNFDWIETANLIAAIDKEGNNIGRTKLLKFLREKEVIQQNKPIPYAEYATCGWFYVVTKLRKDNTTLDTVTLVTPVGLVAIADLLRKDGFILNANIPTQVGVT